MHFPDSPDFPARDVERGRIYTVDARTDLAVFHVEAGLPHAPDGFFVYVFILDGRTVGRWDWTADPSALIRIARIYRETTSPDYDPPEFIAPGGEAPMLRPAVRDELARAMEAARPGAFPGAIDDWRVVIPLPLPSREP